MISFRSFLGVLISTSVLGLTKHADVKRTQLPHLYQNFQNKPFHGKDVLVSPSSFFPSLHKALLGFKKVIKLSITRGRNSVGQMYVTSEGREAGPSNSCAVFVGKLLSAANSIRGLLGIGGHSVWRFCVERDHIDWQLLEEVWCSKDWSPAEERRTCSTFILKCIGIYSSVE